MKKEWFADESFWKDFYPIMFDQGRYARAKIEIDQIVSLLSFKGKSVLDLCCGPGRHAIELAKRGYSVTGVDLSGYLLKKAKKNAQSKNAAVNFIKADMVNYKRANAYDLVINMFTAFGYFENKEDDIKVLKNIYAGLKRNGTLLIELKGKENLAKVYQRKGVSKYPGGTLLIEFHEIVDGWSRIKNEWILVKGDKIIRHKFQHTIYSGQELKDRLDSVGFADIKLYGDLAGSEYGPDSNRLIAVARKPY